jgi:hypothetical protein
MKMKILTAAIAATMLCVAPLGAAHAAPKAPAKAVKVEKKPGLVAQDSKLLVLYANPVEGKETEFLAWYDQHMKDFMKFPNFVKVQRFKMLSRTGRPDPEFKYMFLFEFKGDQNESFAQTQQAIKDGKLPLPPKEIVAKLSASNYGADNEGYVGPAPE